MTRQFVIGLFFIMVLTACTRVPPDAELQAFIEQLRATHATLTPLRPLVQEAQLAQSTHANIEKLDSPFEQQVTTNNARPRELLETYTLESLRLVGTLEQSERRLAVVRASDGKIYLLSIGQRLGRHQGRVTSIQMDRIELLEKSDTTAGRKRTLKFGQKGGS